MTGAYCFGRFTLDPAGRRLYAEGAPAPLGATDVRLLKALVESAGTTVTKDELISRVWGRANVSDDTLYVHISTLRKALGDDYIVNKQGRGYRFMAGVRQAGQLSPAPQVEAQAGNLASHWSGGAPDGPSRLIGRSEHLRTLADLLTCGRLVTLTGHGGIGKTRLALQAANEASPHYGEGVWVVELAALNDPELVPVAIATTLGIEIGANAKPLETLSRQLARKSLLIVLDNCEHLLAACAWSAETLLAVAPGVRILATSREPLSCAGERLFEVLPLALPFDDAITAEALRSVAAVELFVERATGADTGFRAKDDDLPVVARICRRLDGLPLAIEMAAAWAGVLGLEVLDRKLDRALDTLLHARSTAPARHSTLRATLEWSYDLLSAAEQTVLCRLAVFAGSFTMAAAEAVAGCDPIPGRQIFGHVASLVRKSMIAAAPAAPQEKRYRFLQTTRTYMLEKLALLGDGDAVRRRHARYVLDVFEEATRELETTSDTEWVGRYAPVLGDLRAALDWAMAQDPDFAIALAGASWLLWRELSLRGEARQRLSAAISRLRSDTPPALEARLRCGLADLLLNTPEITVAYEEIDRAATLYRTIGDAPRLGGALVAQAFALGALDRAEEAEQAILEAISLLQSAASLRTLARAYSVQSSVKVQRGDFNAALAAGEKTRYLCELVGADRCALVAAANLVQLRLENGDIEDAISEGRSLAGRLRTTRHSELLGYVLGLVAAALTARGDLMDALNAAREATPFLREEGLLFWLFDHLALRAALAGRARDAVLIAAYANAIHHKSGRAREPMARRAVERTRLLLREALPEEQIAELDRLGTQLSEDQAIAIALKSEKMARERAAEPLLQH
ncbi:MAG TPA: winged helix-turn-helix domain-containing protein [Rhizomicrobium sp.]|jgi:predicted ATPase/DNA-binding winged helix-turn-helix (wHTH) protein|nr:winged helix-turn-helix domain-containing protein [Rhizomicrobium sp.]